MTIARPRLFWAAIALAGFILFIDQASKLWMFHWLLRDAEEIPVLSFFSLVKRYNLGISFSLFATGHPIGPWVLSGIALAISGALLIWLSKASDCLAAIGLGLIIGGALGNVIDRLRVGAVMDFLLFYWREWAWPAFNVADSAISVGVAILIVDGILVKSGQNGSIPKR